VDCNSNTQYVDLHSLGSGEQVIKLSVGYSLFFEDTLIS
jgi:hypothetical protein